ncbi:type II toxin-antitoxin system VapC family toxin [bacterium]|nr:MAG: type II toxin-antitoxin system VapC family toxin [bacterium]
MRALLDTHVFLALLAQPERVPKPLRAAVDTADVRLLSVASIWEMAIKATLGKLTLPLPVGEYVASRVAQLQCAILPISEYHAAAVQSLPYHHRDPFDRLIVAQAILEDAVLLTLDRSISRYDVATLPLQVKKKRPAR